MPLEKVMFELSDEVRLPGLRGRQLLDTLVQLPAPPLRLLQPQLHLPALRRHPPNTLLRSPNHAHSFALAVGPAAGCGFLYFKIPCFYTFFSSSFALALGPAAGYGIL